MYGKNRVASNHSEAMHCHYKNAKRTKIILIDVLTVEEKHQISNAWKILKYI